MTLKEMVSEVIRHEGIEGALQLIADACDEAAEQYEDTPSGNIYDRAARKIRECMRSVKEVFGE